MKGSLLHETHEDAVSRTVQLTVFTERARATEANRFVGSIGISDGADAGVLAKDSLAQ